MSLEYIEIRGEKHPIKFGYEAFKLLQKKHGIQIDDVSSVNWENYEPALFYALKMGADEAGVPFNFKKVEEMAHLLNDCLWRFVAMMPSFFPDIEDELAKNSAATGKKPPTGQTRKPKK